MSATVPFERTAKGGSAVKVKSGLPEITKSAKTIRYWIGTTPSSPIQNVTVGGVTFPLFRGSPVFDQDGGKPDRTLDHGIYADLTDERVELIRNGVKIRVIRIWGGTDDDKFETAPGTVKGKGKTAQMLIVDGPHYRRQPNDHPVGEFLYMHRLDAMSAEDGHRFPPETMEGA